MKIFSFIMAFIILALSCLPCKDGAKAISVKGKTEIKVPANKPQHSDADDCSPFCICSCCGIHTSNSNLFGIQHLTVEYSTERELYPQTPLYDISLPVWQPPQL